MHFIEEFFPGCWREAEALGALILTSVWQLYYRGLITSVSDPELSATYFDLAKGGALRSWLRGAAEAPWRGEEGTP